MSELGQALKAARESKEMTLEDLQDITKIQKRYLIALENGDFGQLPGDFYTRAFIKNYAESVGLDAQAFFDEHASEIPKPKNEPMEQSIVPSRAAAHRRKRKPARKPKTSKASSIVPTILVILFIVIVLVAIWLIAQYANGGKSESSPAQTNQTNVSYKKDSTQADSSAAKDSKSKQQDAGKTDKKPAKPEKKMTLTKNKMSGSTSYYTLSNADSFKVKITSSTGSPSWITAVDTSSNKKYAFGSVDKNTSFTFDASGSNEISIKVGSVPNTDITINGKPFDFPSSDITQKIYITYIK